MAGYRIRNRLDPYAAFGRNGRLQRKAPDFAPLGAQAEIIRAMAADTRPTLIPIHLEVKPRPHSKSRQSIVTPPALAPCKSPGDQPFDGRQPAAGAGCRRR